MLFSDQRSSNQSMLSMKGSMAKKLRFAYHARVLGTKPAAILCEKPGAAI